MARTAAKKTARSSARKSSARKSAPARRTTVPAVSSAPTRTAGAASGSVTDLAGGLKSFLSAIETEVRAVSQLSERIDALVSDLNAVREEQAQRLTALDSLQGAAQDGGLSSFLDKLIRPRKTRVTEVVPKRLSS